MTCRKERTETADCGNGRSQCWRCHTLVRSGTGVKPGGNGVGRVGIECETIDGRHPGDAGEGGSGLVVELTDNGGAAADQRPPGWMSPA